MTTAILLRTTAWSLLAFIVFVTLSPIGLRPHTITSVNLDRATAYAIAALAFTLAYPRRWKTAVVMLVLGAMGFEFLQEFQPTRHARLDDALVKAAGVLAGVAIGYAWNKALGKGVARESGI